MSEKFDRFEITIGLILFCFAMFLTSLVASTVGMAAWQSSEKAAAYRAYVDCLRETKERTIDVQQTFCGRIREQL